MSIKIQDPMFAIVTPFTENGEQIDYVALEKYLHFLEEKGVKTILTSGTTGEFASLTLDERKQLVQFCRKHYNGKIVNHIGTSSIKETIELLHHSSNYCDAVISLPPFYYANTTEEGIYQYFRTILRVTTQPFYIYNFPKHTQVTVTNETIVQLKEEFPHLVGIKDSSGNFELSKQYNTTGIDVFVGSDTRAIETLNEGMCGNVSGGGNVLPEFLVNIVENYKRNDLEKVEKWFATYSIWNTFRKGLPVNEIALVKCGLATRIENFPLTVRVPLIECSETEKEMIQAIIRQEILPKLEQLINE